MSNPTVYSVTWDHICNQTWEWYLAGYNQMTPEEWEAAGSDKYNSPEAYYRAWIDYRGNYTMTEAQGEERKRKLHSILPEFINSLEDGAWYQFILTRYQEREFLRQMTEVGFMKYLKYQSPELAFNFNYPEDGPKLRAFVFHFTKES